MSLMHCHLESFPPVFHDFLFYGIRYHFPALRPPEISQVFTGLGVFNIDFNTLSQGYQDIIIALMENALQKSYQDPVVFANALFAFSRLQLKWDMLPARVCLKIAQGLSSFIPSCSVSFVR
jgi:hypothetical protein